MKTTLHVCAATMVLFATAAACSAPAFAQTLNPSEPGVYPPASSVQNRLTGGTLKPNPAAKPVEGINIPTPILLPLPHSDKPVFQK